MLLNDIQEYMLQKQIETTSQSGQKKKDWIDIETLKIAVYLIDEMSVVGNVRYDQYDCAGLTFYNAFDKKEKYRIVGSEAYEIERVTTIGCRTHLLLKRIEHG